MTMDTQSDEAALGEAVIRVPAALDARINAILRRTPHAPRTPTREDGDEAPLVTTSTPQPSPDASSSDAESVCVSSSHCAQGALMAPGYASPADVLGVWTYPLCGLGGLGGMGGLRLACEAPDGGADRKLAVVPDLMYHGLLARSAGALHYPPPVVTDAGSGVFGVFPWPGHLTPPPHPHHPVAGNHPPLTPSKTSSSPTLKFGIDRILSGELCPQDAKKRDSPGGMNSCLRLDCGSSFSSMTYAGLMAPTPLRIFGHATSSQLASRPGGPGAQAAAGGNTSGKRKRSWSRAVFSNLQRKGLEKRFQLQKYITKPDRRQLAATLGLTDAQVKVWFQNRRMKWRHTKESKPQQGMTAPQARLNESPDEMKREHSPTIT